MNNSTYCDLAAFSKSYEEIHGRLSFLVCVFGSIANILNICVLTTKEMRWPTNLILTGLAVADLLVMLEYIPFTFHRYLNEEKRKYIDNYSYNWAVFTIFHALFSQVFHFISCCLTVILAIWRYMAITSPHNSRYWCETKKTFYIIIITYMVCPIICSPLFMSLKILAYNQTCDINNKILDKQDLVNFTGVTFKRIIYITTYVSEDYKYISFWIYGVVIKLVPCILLTHLSRRLISVLLETKKRRKMLMNHSLPLNNIREIKPMLNKKFEKDKQADRTSGMLVAVLLLFLITEFPQAILGLLSATKGHQFEKECYIPLGKCQ
ncbi:hypothetical protein NQ314_018948 [Rhamnusium bicolor]|uniref:G-protein coupled receptors family 1 profile domain-containing protein n=1 Tax=Rhamnusium bicolor TaxID=1586634 RepID=A0AAV8WPM8_9CUCU|nr:hypothetical protein NQ314_018948 [Rhamnusium bicolor]